MRSALQFAIGLVCFSLILRTWVALGLIEPVTVSGTSMEPSLVAGERLVISRLEWLQQPLERWQVVVLRSPSDGQLAVKRIVGLPGEQIDLRDGKVEVDGALVTPPFAHEQAWHQPVEDNQTVIFYTPRSVGQPLRTGPWNIAQGEYFLLGDNSPVSIDSRSWGPIPARLIVGVPLGVR